MVDVRAGDEGVFEAMCSQRQPIVVVSKPEAKPLVQIADDLEYRAPRKQTPAGYVDAILIAGDDLVLRIGQHTTMKVAAIWTRAHEARIGRKRA